MRALTLHLFLQLLMVSPVFAAHLNCLSKDDWSLLDKSGALLGAEKKNNFFEVDSEVQTKLICGNPMRKPPVTLELHPDVKVLEQQPGYRANFERKGKNSFSFWLTSKDHKRICVLSCEPTP